MTRHTLYDFGSYTAAIAAAFVARNAVVLTGLSVFTLIALAR